MRQALFCYTNHEPLTSLQQAFFGDEVGDHVGGSGRNLDAVLTVFRRSETEGVEGPAAGGAEVFFEAVMELAGVFVDFGQGLFIGCEPADEGADDQTGTAQGPTDTARPADTAAHAGSHADSDVRQLEVHRVVTGLEDRFDAVIALQMVLFCQFIFFFHDALSFLKLTAAFAVFEVVGDLVEDFLGLLAAMPVPQAAVDDGDDDEDDSQSHGMFFHHDQVVTNQDLTGDRRQFADETAQDIIAVADAAQRPQGRDQAVRRIRDGPGQGHGLPGTVMVELAQHLALFNDLLGLVAEQSPHEEKADDDADCFGYPGNDSPTGNAKKDAIGRGNEDRRQKADDIDDDVDDHADQDGPDAERAQVVDSPLHIAARRQLPDRAVKVRDGHIDSGQHDEQHGKKGDFNVCFMNLFRSHVMPLSASVPASWPFQQSYRA